MTRPSGLALLLSRLGAHTSARFAARLAAHDLSPAQVGLLRVVGQHPGLSQQAVAERIGAGPSRVVKLVDELAAKGLVERHRSETDRRNHELHVAEGAAERLAAVRATVAEHDAELVAGLSAEELETLLALLRKVASTAGLPDEGHPGYGPEHRPGRGREGSRDS